VGFNALGDEGVMLIATAIHNNPRSKIQDLRLSGVQCEESGAKALVSLVFSHPDVRITHMSNNPAFPLDLRHVLHRACKYQTKFYSDYTDTQKTQLSNAFAQMVFRFVPHCPASIFAAEYMQLLHLAPFVPPVSAADYYESVVSAEDSAQMSSEFQPESLPSDLASLVLPLPLPMVRVIYDCILPRMAEVAVSQLRKFDPCGANSLVHEIKDLHSASNMIAGDIALQEAFSAYCKLAEVAVYCAKQLHEPSRPDPVDIVPDSVLGSTPLRIHFDSGVSTPLPRLSSLPPSAAVILDRNMQKEDDVENEVPQNRREHDMLRFWCVALDKLYTLLVERLRTTMSRSFQLCAHPTGRGMLAQAARILQSFEAEHKKIELLLQKPKAADAECAQFVTDVSKALFLDEWSLDRSKKDSRTRSQRESRVSKVVERTESPTRRSSIMTKERGGAPDRH